VTDGPHGATGAGPVLSRRVETGVSAVEKWTKPVTIVAGVVY
jgi:hypothetical protein